jgi:hypothetical protein
MTTINTSVRRVRRYLTAPVVTVLTVLASLTALFAGVYLDVGGPVRPVLVYAIAGAVVVALVVAAVLIYAAPGEDPR